jgi:ABC-type Na+ efflux pump permease subunit
MLFFVSVIYIVLFLLMQNLLKLVSKTFSLIDFIHLINLFLFVGFGILNSQKKPDSTLDSRILIGVSCLAPG